MPIAREPYKITLSICGNFLKIARTFSVSCAFRPVSIFIANGLTRQPLSKFAHYGSQLLAGPQAVDEDVHGQALGQAIAQHKSNCHLGDMAREGLGCHPNYQATKPSGVFKRDARRLLTPFEKGFFALCVITYLMGIRVRKLPSYFDRR